MNPTNQAAKGFTLVEILIVVIILGILAAMIIPQFSSATESARASMLMDDLRVIRSQLEVFKAQHQGVPAGFPDCDPAKMPTDTAMLEHLTQSSTSEGAVAAAYTPGYPYGPYLREIPTNPFNGKNTVRVLKPSDTFPNSPSDTHGWIYQPSSLLFKADSSGADESGTDYFDY